MVLNRQLSGKRGAFVKTPMMMMMTTKRDDYKRDGDKDKEGHDTT